MKQIAINLLGGPGSGKSTLAYDLAGYLKKMGVNCEYIPEFVKQRVYEKNQMAIDDQLYIFANQRYNMTVTRKEVQVLICDSPLYLSAFYNKRLLEKGKRTVSQEVIIPLIQDCVSQFYNMNYFIWRNHEYKAIGRYQNQAEAEQDEKDIYNILKQMDVQMKELKSTDPCLQLIACELISELEKQKQVKANAEIERKFLVKSVPDHFELCEKHDLVQGYLRTGEIEERVRSVDQTQFVHTIKMGSGLQRGEYENFIDKNLFDALLKQATGNLLLKTRHLYMLKNGKKAEVDIYSAPVKDLRTVEVEFASQEEANGFVPPEWFGKEVTGDKRYSNQYLAINNSLNPAVDIIA